MQVQKPKDRVFVEDLEGPDLEEEPHYDDTSSLVSHESGDDLSNTGGDSSGPSGVSEQRFDPCNVFVKFLHPELTDKQLYTLFAPFGTIVSSKIMVDHQTGNSLGYGFVRFSRAEEAQQAISKMNGAQIGNKKLLCKLSNLPSNLNTNQTPSTNLYIKPLLPTTSDEDLRELFSPFGQIAEVKVMVDKITNLSRQIGFVRFYHLEDATNAMNAMTGYKFESTSPPLVVKYAESETERANRRARLQRKQPQSGSGSGGASGSSSRRMAPHSLGIAIPGRGNRAYASSPGIPMSLSPTGSPIFPGGFFTTGYPAVQDAYGNVQYLTNSPTYVAYGTPPSLAQIMHYLTLASPPVSPTYINVQPNTTTTTSSNHNQSNKPKETAEHQ